MTKSSPLLHVFAAYPRRTETFLRQDLVLLAENGLPVTVCGLGPGDMPAPEGPPEVISLAHRTGLRPAPIHSRTRLERRLPRSLRNGLSRIRHRREIADLTALARRLHVQHLHAEFADLAAIVTAAAATELGITWSLGVHARDVFCFRFSPASIFGRTQGILACNRAAAEAVRALFPPAGDRLEIIPHGVRLDFWSPDAPAEEGSPPTRPSPDRFRLLFVGRFVEKKGLPVLFEALNTLAAEQDFPFHLDIIGDGPLAAPWRARAEELGLRDDKITWHGFRNPEAIRAAMLSADALALPARVAPDGDRDGIPNVILEAMALGCPVVAATVGGIPEIVTSETAFPVPPDRPDLLAEALRMLRRNPARAKARAQRARTRIEREFDAMRLAPRRVRFFRRFLTGAAGAPRW